MKTDEVEEMRVIPSTTIKNTVIALAVGVRGLVNVFAHVIAGIPEAYIGFRGVVDVVCGISVVFVIVIIIKMKK